MVLVAFKPMNSIVLVGLLVTAIHFLHAGRKRVTLPGAEKSMTTTIEFITALFCQVDDHLLGFPKHPKARLWPSEVVTLGLLHALKGVGNHAFYRWLTRDYRPLFPRLPERTRLFRLFTTHHDWTQAFLGCVRGRCRKGVDHVSDEPPKLVPIDEESNHEIVHALRLGEAQRATDEPLDPGPEINVFALDFLRVLLAH